MEPTTLMHAHRRLMGIEPSMEAYSSNRTQNSYIRETNFDTNMVIILAALLCALVFALGLNTILRCAMRCSRWFSLETPEQAAARVAATGLKKRELRKIPVAVYGSTEVEVPVTECPICLEEFVKGDKVRVLPKCSHGFHVRCIDTWLVSHSSCPNCRLSLLECQTGSCASASAALPQQQQQQQEEEDISRTGQQSAEQAGVVVVVDEGG